MCVENNQVFTWGFGILGKGPQLDRSLVPEQIPETLFGANDFRPTVALVDIQCGLHHFAVLTGNYHTTTVAAATVATNCQRQYQMLSMISIQ